MRLSIKYQPLNFDIYLSQVIDIPRTSIEEPPYNFQLELGAIERVEQIIKRTKVNEIAKTDEQQHDLLEQRQTSTSTTQNEKCNSHKSESSSGQNAAIAFPFNNTAIIPSPSCPIETPLTPIKCTVDSTTNNTDNKTNSNQQLDRPQVNQVNPKEFEEIHYNPFDHLELQTIDELRELDLVFQASYANQAAKNNN